MSRKAAGKGKRLLEGLELDLETIDTLIENNLDDMESTAQVGLSNGLVAKAGHPPGKSFVRQ